MNSQLNLWFLVLHILGALWLATGALGGAAVRAATRRASSLDQKVFGLRLARRLMLMFGIPGSIFTGLIGLHLVTARGYGFSPAWVQWSIAIWAVLLALALTVSLPRLSRTVRAAEESLRQGAATAELQRLSQAKWPGMLADLSALGVLVLTWLMSMKPM